MLAIYLSHPQVTLRPDLPVPEWSLSHTGRARAMGLGQQDWVRDLTRIVSSDEVKAMETAGCIAPAAGLPVEIGRDMHENDRSATGFLPPEAFEAAADAFFASPAISFRGWETAIAAQRRIVDAVTGTLQGQAGPILFVGHGAVGTLLRQALQDTPISRSGDQPAGGGNLYAFRLSDRRVLCDWTPAERWPARMAEIAAIA